MRDECRRWIALSDSEATEEPLTAEDREFLRTHASSCPECRVEASIWGGLQALAPTVAPQESVSDEIVSTAQRIPRVAPKRYRRLVLPGAAVALASAAAVALWMGFGGSGPAGPVTASPVAQTSPRQVLPHDNPAPKAPSISKGRTEPSCSEVVPGVTVCLAPDSQIASKSLNGPDRTIELASGRAVVSLVPQAPGTSFSVATSAGKVTAVGTVFSVSIGDDGVSVVRVSHGRVLVRAKATGRARPLSAGEALQIGDDEPVPLAASAREQDLALLPPAIRSREEKAAANSNAVVVPSADHARRSPQQEMLERASSLRARGEFRKAADLYREISEQNPNSALGSAALVSLGELLLSSLNDAPGALNAFDSYLSRGGPLAQEAAFGRVRALRALKRTAEERRSIKQFIATYPGSPQSRVLRQRLAELE